MLVCVSLQGIEWTNIEYFNNAIICDLIENVRQAEFIVFENIFCSFVCDVDFYFLHQNYVLYLRCK